MNAALPSPSATLAGSSSDSAATRRALRTTQALVACSTLLHLLVAPFPGLGTDEAHYALYGLRLDWSYFDHPPLVGWIQALALLLGESEFVLRLAPILISAGCALLLHRLARRALPSAPPWTPTVAVGLVLAAPTIQVITFGALPEHPLMLFGLLALDSLLDVERDDRASAWLRLGLWLGLAGLSKYSAALLLLPVAVVVRRRRAWTRGPAWLAAGLALLLITPVLLWNLEHGGLSFRYQAGRGAGGAWELGDAAGGLLGPLLTWGPVLVVLGWSAALRGWRVPEGRLLRVQGAGVLLVFAVAGGYAVTLPHWTTLGWYALAPLAALRLQQLWTRTVPRVVILASSALPLLLIAFVLLQLATGLVPLPEGQDRYGEITGFDQAATHLQRHLNHMAVSPGPEPGVFVDSRWTASRLAWYARPHAVQVLDRRTDQFDLWFGNPERGARGVLVSWSLDPDAPAPARDLQRFAHTELLERLPVVHRGREVATFWFWGCSDHVR